MDKYQKALLELAKANQAVKNVTTKIAESLEFSRMDAEKWWAKDRFDPAIAPKEWDYAKNGGNGWLAKAYEVDYGELGERHYAHHDGDVEGYLAENCAHALHAHKLIMRRKELRKQLGRAKARVTFLSNRLLAEAQKESTK